MSYRNQSEAALKAHLQTTVGVPVYVGLRDEVKGLPCVVVNFTNAQEAPVGSGNMEIQLQIMVQSEIDGQSSPGALEVHEATVSQVEAALDYQELQALNDQHDHFHYFGKTEHSGPERDTQDLVVTETFLITLAAALGNF